MKLLLLFAATAVVASLPSVAGLPSSAGVTGAEPTNGTAIFPGGQVPGERNGTIGPEVWSGKYGGSFYNVQVPALYARVVANASAPVVIVNPGGAYTHLSWDLEGESAAAWLNSLNVSAYILKYRVPLRQWLDFGEAPLMDLQRAMGLVRSWHAPGTKVGVLGFSAGSHLSAHISNNFATRAYPRVDAADDQSCKPDFTMLLYPWCVIGSSVGWHYGSNCQDHGPNHTLSLDVTKATPPTFLAQAEDDPVQVENSLFYYLGLKTNGVKAEMHLYPSGGHGFGLCKPAPNRDVCTWTDRAAQWLAGQGLVGGEE